MKYDVLLAGVGGQGVLSIAAIIAKAASAAGLQVRQSEVHGMAQRGGAVLAHLRLADKAIASDLVPRGEADLIISMEPLESLRYTDWLSPEGAIVTAAEPVLNIPNYPEPEKVYQSLSAFPKQLMVEASKMAREAGLPKALNMVISGAASRYLPLEAAALKAAITDSFAAKGEAVLAANLKAFDLGRGEA
jgi:indolepyruvate ferredoxin oxidoreductase beta subunit